MSEIKKLGGLMNLKGFDILSQKTPDILKFEDKEQICPKHGKVICYTTFFDDGTEEWSCPLCQEEKLAAEKKVEDEKQKEEAQRNRLQQISFYRDCNIEPEFYDKTLKDYVPKTPSQRKAKEVVEKMIMCGHGKVVLLGPNGVGKTALACAAVKELGGKIYSMYEISTMIRQSYTVKATRTELEIVNELASIPFLAIDELGRTKCSESELNWLSYILDKRHTRRLPFMLMTNGHFKSACENHGCPKCFENFLDNDILSRLRQDSSVVVIDGPDERRAKKA